MEKSPTVLYFNYFNNVRPQAYLVLAFYKDQNHSHSFFLHLKKIKATAAPYFGISKKIKLQQYLISAFSIAKNSSGTLFLLFQQYKTPAVL